VNKEMQVQVSDTTQPDPGKGSWFHE